MSKAGAVSPRTKEAQFTDLVCKMRTRSYQPGEERDRTK
jgi:hypothetical protein